MPYRRTKKYTAERERGEQGEPVAWIVYTKDRKFIRACWTVPPSEDQRIAAEFDGDIIVPTYASPPKRKPLTDEQARSILRDADWPESMLSGFVFQKLSALIRQTERTHGIGDE